MSRWVGLFQGRGIFSCHVGRNALNLPASRSTSRLACLTAQGRATSPPGSVFLPPCRAALRANGHEEGSAINREATRLLR